MKLDSTETSIPADPHLVVEVSWPDRRLVEACLSGNEGAWAALVVAASLGIAVGSVGFIRRRCLDPLRISLEEAGF